MSHLKVVTGLRQKHTSYFYFFKLGLQKDKLFHNVSPQNVIMALFETSGSCFNSFAIAL